ncbi:transmembrane protein 158 [Latimeria chalumnae]|uniref:transmembrane protein 158 n=1 Tax=Latimeria chalumnae TaxID=7897 RepID=UPI0003C16EC9|nr:PREDICTED: transmembrane protein 158 [Latimeria chalumnae]|eukprot:XP_005999053.1 PREDICTED: transmembrane protein 158 [Latimeria chalumnae]
MLNFCFLLLALIAAIRFRGSRCWSGEDLLLPPINSSRSLANLELDLKFTKRSAAESEAQRGFPQPQCNISVQRLMSTTLVVHWNRQLGIPCNVLIFTANNHGRAFFSAAFNRVTSPVVIEHLGVSGGHQEFTLCVGCGRRAGQVRTSSSSSSVFPPQGELLNFCCLDFSLDELKGDQSWRLNRKPIESTLVACFMTLVIIVWSVAALIWPVPIIAGFLPNGMEQRRAR